VKLNINPNNQEITGVIEHKYGTLITGGYKKKTLDVELKVTHLNGKINFIEGKFLDDNFSGIEGTYYSGDNQRVAVSQRITMHEL